MVIAILQARMGASRLPGKVLKKINSKELLLYQCERINKSNYIKKLVVATTQTDKDRVIYDFCKKNNIEVFRGDEHDVLSRYYNCAKSYNAKMIVRLTGDCPLIDPKIIDKTIDCFKANKSDYCCNTCPPQSSTFPDGSDVEVFSFNALERAYNECKNKHDREHVTFYFWKYNNGFKLSQLKGDKNYSKYRITIDYPEDLEVISFLINKLKKLGRFGYLEEIVEILESHPEIRQLNSNYFFGVGWNQK